MSASFAATAAWGLAVLASFVGWGGVVGAWLFGSRKSDVGLRAAWGMAFAILFGGCCLLFHLASPGMIVAFVGLGIVCAVIIALREPRVRFDLAGSAARWKERPGSSLLLVLCVGAALVQYAGSICNLRFNPNDDFMAYFPFARQILQQGTLFDPFSTRRIMSLGGHSFLHALVLAGSPGFRLHLLDQGICLLTTALLVLGSRTADRPALPALLALILLLTLPDIRINTYSEMSGVVVFYGLYRTLVWLDRREVGDGAVASAAVVALVASAACTLRSNYIAVCVPMVALSYAHLVWNAGEDRGKRLRETAWAAALSFAFLIPWMVLSYQSSGTPLFPLFKGHFNEAFPMLQTPGHWRQELSNLAATVTRNGLMRTFPLLFLAGFLLPDRGPRKPLRALLMASFIGWVLLVHTLASDVPSFERYVYGFLVSGALAVTTGIAFDTGQVGRLRSMAFRVGRIIAVGGALGQLYLVGGQALAGQALLVRRMAILAKLPIRSLDLLPVARSYRAVQARVPPGRPLLVMVNYPFLFDFARNDIYNIDTAAAVSPPPGLPYFRGGEAVADYLRRQSIRFLTFVPHERALSLYRRDFWQQQQRDPYAFWHAQAPVYLDMFDNIASLAASRRVVYDDPALVLLDLDQPARKNGPERFASSKPTL